MQCFSDVLNLVIAMKIWCSKKISSSAASCSFSRNWSDLHGELLLEITNRLALIELYSFRGVCKDWRAATSTASAIVEQSDSSPWLLIHETDNTICTFYNPQKDRTHYTANLPELATSTCIASNHGWLLLFQAGKIFFFSPFSRAKINLPMFVPSSEVTDHVATFTNPPTSEECTVCVIHRIDSSQVEINFMVRGEETWKRVYYDCPVQALGAVVGATSYEGTFYFMDNFDKVLAYRTGNKEWMRHTIVKKCPPGTPRLPFSLSRAYFENSGLQKWLKFGDETSVSICGGATAGNHIILNEKIEASEVVKEEEAKCHRHLKGIWVMQPRIPQTVQQTW